MSDFERRRIATKAGGIHGELARGRRHPDDGARADAFHSLSPADRQPLSVCEDLERLVSPAWLIGCTRNFWQALDAMVRDRAGGNGPAFPTNPVHTGVGTK